MQILTELNSDGISVIIVTHEVDVAVKADRIVLMQDGLIVSDEADSSRRQSFRCINLA